MNILIFNRLDICDKMYGTVSYILQRTRYILLRREVLSEACRKVEWKVKTVVIRIVGHILTICSS